MRRRRREQSQSAGVLCAGGCAAARARASGAEAARVQLVAGATGRKEARAPDGRTAAAGVRRAD